MATKYLDYNGLAYFWEKLKNVLSTKVDKVDGKQLSSNDFTSAEKTKLANIATGAQVNVLEGIQKNGTTVTITNKIANITVPTKTSDITNDSGFITSGDIPEGAAASTTTPKMDGTAAVGTELAFARGDHRHPTDTSRAPLASPALTGTPTAPTASANTDTTQIATTAFVHDVVDALDTGVSDVTVGGTSVVSGGVAAIPNATTSASGAMSATDKDNLEWLYDNLYDFVSNSYYVDALIADSSSTTNNLVAFTSNANTWTVPTTSMIGSASGICPLNASSKIDSTYLPSYVDDVIEAYPRSGATELSSTWLSATSGGSALTPEAGKIYVLMANSTSYAANTQFRWGGTAYVKLADGGVSSITNAEIDTIVAS